MLLMILLVACAGIAGIYRQTEGFTVLTTEAARRADVIRHPRTLPDAILRDQSGITTTLRHDLSRDGRLTVVNFMYTQCFTICLAMGSELERLQAALKSRGLTDTVRLLSISFDPSDAPDRLARYAQSMHADAADWRFVAVPDATRRKALLDAFGIVVVPAPMGQFEHNAAYHLVSPDGRLLRIIDIGDPEALLAYVMRAIP